MDTPNLPNQSPPAGPPPGNNDAWKPNPAPANDGNRPQPLQQQWQERPPVMEPPTQTQASSPTNTQPQDPNGVDATSTQPQQPPQPDQQTQQSAQESRPDQANIPPGYQESAFIPGMAKPQPEEILLEWSAESRPYIPRKRKHFTTIGLICVLIALILFFAGQMLAVAVLLAVFFLYYVLNSTPPGQVTHQFTTYGIRVEGTLYYWEEMGRFWFTEKMGKDILHIEIARFPFRLTMLLSDIEKEDMKALLSEILLFQVPPLTMYEKVAKWFQEKLPIDIDGN